MNREFIKTQGKELETLIETFAKLLGEEFEGIGPGQTFLTDEQYVKWFDMQVAKRPNFVQMLLMPGVQGGRAMVLKYAKLTGAEAIMPVLVKMFATGREV